MSDNSIAARAAVRPAETITPIGVGWDVDGPIYMVTANGENGLETEVVDVREGAPNAFPPRVAQPRCVTDVASLLAEVARRPLLPGVSTVWARRPAGTVTVIYNDLDGCADEQYTRRDDQLTLQFVADPDWKTILKTADGQFHGQEAFGDLIESAGHLITSHQTAELMEIVDSIRASSKGAFESKIRRDTGEQHLLYSEEISTKAGSATRALEVPREITLSAAPFEDYPRIDVTCWLRLRINSGQLMLGLFPQPFEHLIRNAWTDVIAGLSDALGVPVYAANL